MTRSRANVGRAAGKISCPSTRSWLLDDLEGSFECDAARLAIIGDAARPGDQETVDEAVAIELAIQALTAVLRDERKTSLGDEKRQS